jgi:hypothetical protein
MKEKTLQGKGALKPKANGTSMANARRSLKR